MPTVYLLILSRNSPLCMRQRNDIKTIGCCKARPSPLKFANTQVKCEFIRQSRIAQRSPAVQPRFSAVSRSRQPRNGKTGSPSSPERRVETAACRERDQHSPLIKIQTQFHRCVYRAPLCSRQSRKPTRFHSKFDASPLILRYFLFSLCRTFVTTPSMLSEQLLIYIC